MVAVGTKRPREEDNTAGAVKVDVKAVPTPGGPAGTAGEAKKNTGNVSEFSEQLLKVYYEQMFPYGHMAAWLGYHGDPNMDADKVLHAKYWKKREFCFTMKDDVYIRYNSYHTMNDFRVMLKKRCPYKIDIGAIYNCEPKKKASAVSFNAEEKEIVFDIDITDYDDVRSCCSGGAVCTQCWPLMTCAIKVLNIALEKYFGFKHKLWVFSGRRGIHCWIGDPGTQQFTGRIRTAIIHFLHTFVGNDTSAYKVDFNLLTAMGNVKPIHIFYEEVFPICMQYFKKVIIENLDLFMQKKDGSDEPLPYFHTFCAMIREKELRLELYQEVGKLYTAGKLSSSEQLWELIEKAFEKHKKKHARGKGKMEWLGYTGCNQVDREKVPGLLRANMMEIVFSYVFPRVDVEVTKGVNHLLKSPFCAHPKTGKICVPMDYHNIDNFDPTNQPTLRTIHEELLEHGDVAKTAIGKATEVFERTFLNGLKDAWELHERQESEGDTKMTPA